MKVRVIVVGDIGNGPEFFPYRVSVDQREFMEGVHHTQAASLFMSDANDNNFAGEVYTTFDSSSPAWNQLDDHGKAFDALFPPDWEQVAGELYVWLDRLHYTTTDPSRELDATEKTTSDLLRRYRELFNQR